MASMAETGEQSAWTENEELRKLAQMEQAHPFEGPRAVIDEMNNLRRKLGLVTP
jgi:hypothetical protein